MTQGKQNKAIAQDLGVSPRTIEIHRARVMEKMNAQSVAQLVRMMLDLQHATAVRMGAFLFSGSGRYDWPHSVDTCTNGVHPIPHPPDTPGRRRARTGIHQRPVSAVALPALHAQHARACRALIEQFVNVDYHRTMALVAVIGEGDRERIIGVARYAADTDESCEFAVAVADDWQCRGIGTTLMPLLFEHAARAGFTHDLRHGARRQPAHDRAGAMARAHRGSGTTRGDDGASLASTRLMSTFDRRVPADARQVVGESQHLFEIEWHETFAMGCGQRQAARIDGIVDLPRKVGGMLA